MRTKQTGLVIFWILVIIAVVSFIIWLTAVITRPDLQTPGRGEGLRSPDSCVRVEPEPEPEEGPRMPSPVCAMAAICMLLALILIACGGIK